MKIKIALISLFFGLAFNFVLAKGLQPAITKPIPIQQLQDYGTYPLIIKKLITEAHALTQRNLTYHYNSADPKNSGMDCSGTIYYLLKKMGIYDVPRDSYGMYQWILAKGKFHQVHANSFSSADFFALKPGDLLFWSGTYFVKRSPPISHVMIYLGKNKQNQPLMFGASDGRTYLNKKMWGVSVFDFKLPKENSKSKFVGYSCIPGLSCS